MDQERRQNDGVLFQVLFVDPLEGVDVGMVLTDVVVDEVLHRVETGNPRLIEGHVIGAADRAGDVAPRRRIEIAVFGPVVLLDHGAEVVPVLETVDDGETYVSVLRRRDVGEDARNVIPAEATASVDMRLAAGDDPQRMLELVNEERTRAGLDPLEFDDQLREVARAHSREMFELGYFGHQSPVTGSVADTTDLSRLVDTAVDTYGRVDAVVNNTGHPPKGDLLDIGDEDWHAGLDLLLLNVIRMARLVTPIMASQGGGAIVNVSTSSAYAPSLSSPVSSVLRAGLGGFAKMYADRYGPDGIRMNNVLPGFMDSYPSSEENIARIPLGRYGKVEELAAAIAFLLSADGTYLTGQNIRVDGGLARSV